MGLIYKNIIKKKKKDNSGINPSSSNKSFFTVISPEDLAKLRNTAYSYIL